MKKPPYRVPTMEEIAARPLSGLTAAVLFAGFGGFDLGARTAGVDVLWANEWAGEDGKDTHAQETYSLNHRAILDSRDVHDVSADDIVAALGRRPDILIASPPCTKFSTSGPGAKGYDGVTERLSFEVVRLLAELAPRAFVIENVPAMATSRDARPYFVEVIRRTSALGYFVVARVLDPLDYGVPQRRPRLIFIGLRGRGRARFPKPLRWRYSVRDALPYVERVEIFNHAPYEQSADLPLPTLCASTQQSIEVRTIGGDVRPITVEEMKALCGVPQDFKFPPTSTYAQMKARLGNCVPPPLGAAVIGVVRDALRRK